MKKLAATLTFFVLMGFTSPALAHHKYSEKQCGYHWQQSQRQLVSMVRCLAIRRGAPGGVSQTLQTLSCESGLNPKAVNGRYKGLGQQDKYYWAARAAHYGYQGASPFNARANADVSIRMARDDGTWSRDWPYCGTL